MSPFIFVVVAVGFLKLVVARPEGGEGGEGGEGEGGGGGAPALVDGMDEVVIAMVPVDSRRRVTII